MKRTINRRFLPGAVAAALGLGFLAPAPARPDGYVTTSMLASFEGQFHANGERIQGAGVAQVVVQAYPRDPLAPPNPIHIHTRLLAFEGVGLDSGIVYSARGAASFLFNLDPNNTYSFRTRYPLILLAPRPPRDPNPIELMLLHWGIKLKDDGTLDLASSNVTLVGGGLDSDP